MNQARGKVVVGLSGGVDSAVAAWLLQQQGYDVQAVFMKNWSEDDFGGPCPWAEDQASAEAVARHLNIPLVTWNFEPEYRQRVFQVMLHEYEQGRTPNPDILCNREIKFDLFLKKALELAPLIATGHYARTNNGKLYKAIDDDKDQSYFLAAVSSEALKHTLFPLGDLKKINVRTIAKDAGLPNWDRPDSVGICFVGEKNMVKFLSKYITWNPGPITLSSGEKVGQHRGLQFYTIGQRHGFGVDLDQKKMSKLMKPGQPVFVSEKRTADNALIIAPADKPEALEMKEFVVTEPHWIYPSPQKVTGARPWKTETGIPTKEGSPVFPWTGTAKLRYRQPDVPVTLVPEGQNIRVICQTPQRAVTPGQYAVFYQGDECLGSAVIDNVDNLG